MAMCIEPESLAITTTHRAAKAMNDPRVSCPASEAAWRLIWA